jgi:predicted DNA-binding transcriptional regulator AlpA
MYGAIDPETLPTSTNDPTYPNPRPPRELPSEDELQTLVHKLGEALKSPSVGSHDGSTNWLTNEEAMEFLDVSRSTLKRYRLDGKLPYSKIGQKIYYRLEDIREMLEENLRNRREETADL